jgi:hypothetical protein
MGTFLSPREVEMIRVDFVEGAGPTSKVILKGGEVVVTSDPQSEKTVFEATRSRKKIDKAPKGAKRYRPEGANG